MLGLAGFGTKGTLLPRPFRSGAWSSRHASSRLAVRSFGRKRWRPGPSAGSRGAASCCARGTSADTAASACSATSCTTWGSTVWRQPREMFRSVRGPRTHHPWVEGARHRTRLADVGGRSGRQGAQRDRARASQPRPGSAERRGASPTGEAPESCERKRRRARARASQPQPEIRRKGCSERAATSAHGHAGGDHEAGDPARTEQDRTRASHTKPKSSAEANPARTAGRRRGSGREAGGRRPDPRATGRSSRP